MKVADPCGCFPTGRHYPGIAHLLKVRAVGVAAELDASGPWVDCPIALIDTETTGRDPATDRLIEVGVVLGLAGEVTRRESWLINPGRPIPKEQREGRSGRGVNLEGVKLVAPLDVSVAA